MTDDLVGFLKACLDEDVQAARAAQEDPSGWGRSTEAWQNMTDKPWRYWDADAIVEHIARHDPARVLAEVAAKRRIIAAYEHKAESMARYPNQGNANGLFSLTVVMQHLAAVYADRPGFREEWRA